MAGTLKTGKLLLFRVARSLGVTRLMLDSSWRRNRLLILCYHGTSIADEHEWDPCLFIPPARLRSRLELLRAARCNVLPLGTALRRLYAGDLPPRSVAITYDDGTHDFYSQAFPILDSFGFPATVYLTSYYAAFNRPVYDVMLGYLLWKAQGRTLCWPEVLESSAPVELTGPGKEQVLAHLLRYPATHRLSGADKDALLCRLAELLAADYSSILAKKVLHIMSVDEIRELVSRGVDMQLHTHRHLVSLDRRVFEREIHDNREFLKAAGVPETQHFCYPGGVHRAEFLPWLRETGIASATICESGLASRRSDRLLLPRFVDTSGASEEEFCAWLSGIASFLPRRKYIESRGQFRDLPSGSGTPGA